MSNDEEKSKRRKGQIISHEKLNHKIVLWKTKQKATTTTITTTTKQTHTHRQNPTKH